MNTKGQKKIKGKKKALDNCSCSEDSWYNKNAS